MFFIAVQVIDNSLTNLMVPLTHDEYLLEIKEFSQ